MTIRRMRIPCSISKAKNTHSEYEILITFPLQQWSRVCASMLRHLSCLDSLTLLDSIQKIAVIEDYTVIGRCVI
jgi:hypothetical protein